MTQVPKFARTPDWPRKVATTVNRQQNDIIALQAADTTAGGRLDALETATDWSALSNYADDAAAAVGGVAVGELYRTGSIVKVRVA